jgi:predicted transcriptional regulator
LTDGDFIGYDCIVDSRMDSATEWTLQKKGLCKMRGVHTMTVEEYRISLGWTAAELGRRSGLSARTIARVENGEAVYAPTVGAIARALSEALGRVITIRDIDGVNIAER